jgi:hypothetical protein
MMNNVTCLCRCSPYVEKLTSRLVKREKPILKRQLGGLAGA